MIHHNDNIGHPIRGLIYCEIYSVSALWTFVTITNVLLIQIIVELEKFDSHLLFPSFLIESSFIYNFFQNWAEIIDVLLVKSKWGWWYFSTFHTIKKDDHQIIQQYDQKYPSVWAEFFKNVKKLNCLQHFGNILNDSELPTINFF